jgi:enterochelin esterase family protein
MPSAPKPGPCPLPILPALAAMEDTAFFGVRDVPHGKVSAVKDIIPYVDRHFRTLASREGRALAGLSMGGFVVMHSGLSRLDTFSELYVYSSGHFPDALPKFEERFRALFEDEETNSKFRVPFYMAQGETDIA